jgi:hypothetical protein
VFEKYLKGRPSELDEPIDKLLKEIDRIGPADSEYPKKVEELEKLWKLRAGEPRAKLNWNTLIGIGGQVLIVVIMVGYEQKHVIATKALNLLPKFKSS